MSHESIPKFAICWLADDPEEERTYWVPLVDVSMLEAAVEIATGRLTKREILGLLKARTENQCEPQDAEQGGP